MTFCSTCGHPTYQHGDRAVGGLCAGSKRDYPNHCDCDEYREGVTNGPAVGAA